MVPGIGSGRFQKILKHVSSPARLLAYQTRDWLQIPGIGTQIAEQLSNRFQEIRLESLLQQCDAHDIGICLLGDCDYPSLLAEIHDPPPVIFWQGKQSLLAKRAIAVVGSRRSTQYGDSITRSLVSDLIRTDLTVVSGLARGIDRVAHEVALEKGGATLAVIASGHGVIYPP
ncbi:MAG: DNA-processing protein DprA, partial [Planctomycetota bacterium]|nr:DNA-processing protein DprA [Planctomycetota bacterium]